MKYKFAKILTEKEMDLVRFHLHKIWELDIHKNSYERKIKSNANQIKQFEKEIKESKKELSKLGLKEVK